MCAFGDELNGLLAELRALPPEAVLSDSGRLVLLECLAIVEEIADAVRALSLAGVLPGWVGRILAPLLGLVAAAIRERVEDGVGN